jgi:site-specific DNA recombinase
MIRPKSNLKSDTKRAAVYVRVSTGDQAEDGYGLDVQLQRDTAQIVAKGWKQAGVYEDLGISGTKDENERPGLAALLADARAGKFDALVVLALDRLGRKTRLVLELVEKLAEAGVDLVSCKESLDTSTPQGRFVLTLFAALAELERDSIVERTTAGRNERGRQDGERGGRVPMGYIRADHSRIEIDPQRAGLVRRMFAMRRSGMTLLAIAAQLNSEAITTMRGHRWHASSVREVLENESIYRGGHRWQSDVRWPVILAA